ncbi:general secretion pathway protein J [Halospina denitrificans]|uniref:Type II secretion system protein J n=1 Tax=Halospina denitrificans TaxID=332522 RepID=A0A4R7JSV6_9GAMM|nr:type II secretion system minor pseudopilin GspJ [Halospina denitrificans]TDT41371.1 general secretion pathway protein J [Halospina denitrificans]
MHRGQQGGFTLLEILVAVFITAMLSLGVWQVMDTLMASREGVERVSGQFREVQRTMSLLERDLFQAIKRPVKDGFGESVPSMTSRNQNINLALTRQGWRNPLGKRRSELQRVAWEHNEIEGRVIRRFWSVVDRASNSESREQQVMSHVEAMEVRFLDADDNWVEDWPKNQQDGQGQSQTQPQQGQGGPAAAMSTMPRAVEVTFEHERFGTLRRVVGLGETPSASFSAPQGGGENQDNGEEEQGQGERP